MACLFFNKSFPKAVLFRAKNKLKNYSLNTGIFRKIYYINVYSTKNNFFTSKKLYNIAYSFFKYEYKTHKNNKYEAIV